MPPPKTHTHTHTHTHTQTHTQTHTHTHTHTHTSRNFDKVGEKKVTPSVPLDSTFHSVHPTISAHGVEPGTKFSKSGSLKRPQLLEKVDWKEGDDFFQGKEFNF